jgi:hypothetical protein
VSRNAADANAPVPAPLRTIRRPMRRTGSGRWNSSSTPPPTPYPIKIVSIVDEHTRECLGGLVERSITADVLIDELDRLAAVRGYPGVLRCDNGPELACDAMSD